MIRFTTRAPYFSINDRDLSEKIREVGFTFKSDARPFERGMLDIAPGPDRNVLEETIFALTGGRACIIFREKNHPAGPENPEYRGMFNLSTRNMVQLDETVGAFGMDLAGPLYCHRGDASAEAEL